LFGAYVQPGSHTGPDRRSALTSFESLVARKMAMEPRGTGTVPVIGAG